MERKFHHYFIDTGVLPTVFCEEKGDSIIALRSMLCNVSKRSSYVLGAISQDGFARCMTPPRRMSCVRCQPRYAALPVFFPPGPLFPTFSKTLPYYSTPAYYSRVPVYPIRVLYSDWDLGTGGVAPYSPCCT
jgi:hypothetical protein